MLTTYLNQLMQKKDLTEVQCRSAIFEIINGAPSEQIAAFLALLHNKPETADELYGIVSAMQTKCYRFLSMKRYSISSGQAAIMPTR